ncbi:EAL domain-containing protein [[Leptolyngbya] sp. PCC 7376]|uniref:EAL domain-containing protein n=1 Tax=[Leptolyngbya] sp. PCC 7376 TaxID=111781 RepID=UPI0013579DA9|nr:EAL domain-containing protein [[Leptolyngbya] sp. PCC 7376]
MFENYIQQKYSLKLNNQYSEVENFNIFKSDNSKIHTPTISTLEEIDNSINRSIAILKQIQQGLEKDIETSLAFTLKEQEQLKVYDLSLLVITLAFGSGLMLLTMRRFSHSLEKITQKSLWISRNAQADKDDWLSERLTEQELDKAIALNDGVANLSLAFNQMVESLAENRIQQVKIKEQLAEETQLLSFTLRSIGDGVITTNQEGIITSANLAAEALLSCPATQIRGKTLDEIFNDPQEDEKKQWHLSKSQESCWLTLKNYGNEAKVFDISHAPILSEDKEVLGIVVVFRDMTALLDATKELFWQASHDPLTKLANRREFQSQLESLRQTHDDPNTMHSILYLDLDRFKIVNDTCGHDAGDALLKQISQRMKEEIRAGDTLARLGGDEFGIILKYCPVTNAMIVAEKILTMMQKYRFIWGQHQFSLGVSIGVVPYSPNEDEPLIVMKAADAACYGAKNQGRNQIYTVDNNESHLDGQNREMNWLARINHALEKNHFCLYQQKISSLVVDDIAHEHFEILIRLRTEDGKILSPGSFLPIAERYQLMTKIDRWVISHFLESQHIYLQEMWNKYSSENVSKQSFYSLNLSADSLNDPEFLPFLEEQFRQYHVPPEVICFEITETVAIANLHRAIKIIRAIKDLGCRFALDDFGSGMSSFGYLQTLPVDFLKIDGLFIRELCQNSMNEIIVTALNQVAKAVNIQTIAEFVEDEATIEKLQEIGVDYAQGYGIARPQPLPQRQRTSSKELTKTIIH